MANTIKGRAKLGADGQTEVKLIITHPMVIEQRDAGGKVTTEAHFIQVVSCTHKGETVFAADWGMAVSTNPYLEFFFAGAAAGDELTIQWSDNRGNSDNAVVKVG